MSEYSGVPWDGTGHPIAILTGFNEEMQQWDVHFSAGAFPSEEEAEAYADALAEHLREWPPLRFLKATKATVVDVGTA